ncbi:matrix metallopeptidase 23bb isoform X3 [Simochromis diagramma]|uniref:matrix metallopeptidase 23bb isoform X3 n=1 Tax=Simochromis diagramma TaxID=43689 RepID=UPI001A7ED988|nr:matrix metallopeptidase 23bb isoform X3 [Simochromis diagramma]
MDPVQLMMMMVMVMMKVSVGTDFRQTGREQRARSQPEMSDSSRSMEVFGDRAARSKRYAINPLGHKWTHHNITYRIIKFPNTLNVEDTRKAIGIAFTKWSDVSPLTFTEVTDGNDTADITIGFYTFNHTDCWWSPLHPCFDGLNGELAHAFLPPRGEIHFDNHEFWILGKSRFSWKQGCLDKKRVCDPWARLGFCERRKTFMKKNCPQRCDFCYEPLEVVTTATPPAANTKIKMVPRGKVVGFRCGTKSTRFPPKISWYKDGEQILSSIPGYIVMKDRDLRIVANEFNEGVYTCRVHRRGDIVSANSWAIRLKPEQASNS